MGKRLIIKKLCISLDTVNTAEDKIVGKIIPHFMEQIGKGLEKKNKKPLKNLKLLIYQKQKKKDYLKVGSSPPPMSKKFFNEGG